MAKRQSAHTEEEAGEAWLLPYSDLMTLMLAVFIVLFAASKLDAARAQQMATQFSGMIVSTTVAGGEALPSGGTAAPAAADEVRDFLGDPEYQEMEKIKAKLDQALQERDMTGAVTTGIDMRGLVIRMNNAVLFGSGQADIKEENAAALLEIAEILDPLSHYIRIEGHTDNTPIQYSPYPSNWELSTARAVSVVKLFIDQCGYAPDKLVAVGYGEYRPIADNKTAAGKAQNRRIDIIVLSSKYDKLEENEIG